MLLKSFEEWGVNIFSLSTWDLTLYTSRPTNRIYDINSIVVELALITIYICLKTIQPILFLKKNHVLYAIGLIL